jgi:hypothetical protein
MKRILAITPVLAFLAVSTVFAAEQYYTTPRLNGG